ncbi:hypothetical protein SARC_13318, partial [Sphaeroforma arctica JP610]
SILVSNIKPELAEDKAFDEELKSLATYSAPQATKESGTYNIDPSTWEEYSPFFYHFDTKDRQSAEKARALRNEKLKANGLQRTSHRPTKTPPAFTQAFAPVTLLLDSPVLHTVLLDVFVRTIQLHQRAVLQEEEDEARERSKKSATDGHTPTDPTTLAKAVVNEAKIKQEHRDKYKDKHEDDEMQQKHEISIREPSRLQYTLTHGVLFAALHLVEVGLVTDEKEATMRANEGKASSFSQAFGGFAEEGAWIQKALGTNNEFMRLCTELGVGSDAEEEEEDDTGTRDTHEEPPPPPTPQHTHAHAREGSEAAPLDTRDKGKRKWTQDTPAGGVTAEHPTAAHSQPQQESPEDVWESASDGASEFSASHGTPDKGTSTSTRAMASTSAGADSHTPHKERTHARARTPRHTRKSTHAHAHAQSHTSTPTHRTGSGSDTRGKHNTRAHMVACVLISLSQSRMVAKDEDLRLLVEWIMRTMEATSTPPVREALCAYREDRVLNTKVLRARAKAEKRAQLATGSEGADEDG